MTAVLLGLVLALVVAIPAQASTQFDAGATSPVASQQLPNFIPSDAVTMSDEEMNEVRGENVFINILTGAIIGTATLKVLYGDALCNTGWCFVTPWFLKPLYAS